MNRLLSIVLAGLLMSGLIIALPSATKAQDQGKRQILRVRDVEVDEIKSPTYKFSGLATMRVQQKDWLQIQTEFDTAPEWIDELTFTYYVLLKGEQNGQTIRTLFVGEEVNVNIEKGNRHLSVMYVHPSTLARYGDPEAVAVLIKHQGKLEAMETEPASNRRWWEEFTPRSGYVLSRMDTPFAMVNYDAYEAVKPRDSGR